MSEQGIVGRGILLDYHTWRLAQTPPIPYSAFTHSSIPLSHLLAVAAAQKTEIHFGDILLIRSGYFIEQNHKSEAELSVLKDQGPPNFGGVEQSMEVLRWIWENFSAVAGDQPSFECWRMFFVISFSLVTSTQYQMFETTRIKISGGRY